MRWDLVWDRNTEDGPKGSTASSRSGAQSLVDEVKHRYPIQAFFYRHFGKIALAVVLMFAFLLGFIVR